MEIFINIIIIIIIKKQHIINDGILNTGI